MKTDEPRNTLGGPRGEGGEAAEERMEDWYRESVTSEFEEGEVVRGRVVHVGSSEVLVDVGYKSEGAIPIEEFQRHGALPKVGDEIEVYLEAKEDAEGLIVLSKDKADKIKVWDSITQAYEKSAPVEGRVVEVVKGGLSVDVGV
ncbi:MAG: S1 RNA-binding domain-containing protein, partial [Candidatus Rokubacteria bacterium]|nr:S1 RNA-binding domain-containing protein [Candidatus Rokubacteria bacterium]